MCGQKKTKVEEPGGGKGRGGHKKQEGVRSLSTMVCVADNFDADSISGSTMSIPSPKVAPGVKTSSTALQLLPFQATPHRNCILLVYRVCVSHDTSVEISQKTAYFRGSVVVIHKSVAAYWMSLSFDKHLRYQGFLGSASRDVAEFPWRGGPFLVETPRSPLIITKAFATKVVSTIVRICVVVWQLGFPSLTRSTTYRDSNFPMIIDPIANETVNGV
jgi:hypothetical protein